MVVVSSEVLPVYEQVVVLVELPELAVDDVEVLVAEEVGHLWMRNSHWEFYESSSMEDRKKSTEGLDESTNFNLFELG